MHYLKDIVVSLNDVSLAWIVRLPAEFAVFFLPSVVEDIFI
jgi:hypothetical protein